MGKLCHPVRKHGLCLQMPKHETQANMVFAEEDSSASIHGAKPPKAADPTWQATSVGSFAAMQLLLSHSSQLETQA